MYLYKNSFALVYASFFSKGPHALRKSCLRVQWWHTSVASCVFGKSTKQGAQVGYTYSFSPKQVCYGLAVSPQVFHSMTSVMEWHDDNILISSLSCLWHSLQLNTVFIIPSSIKIREKCGFIIEQNREKDTCNVVI